MPVKNYDRSVAQIIFHRFDVNEAVAEDEDDIVYWLRKPVGELLPAKTPNPKQPEQQDGIFGDRDDVKDYDRTLLTEPALGLTCCIASESGHRDGGLEYYLDMTSVEDVFEPETEGLTLLADKLFSEGDAADPVRSVLTLWEFSCWKCPDTPDSYGEWDSEVNLLGTLDLSTLPYTTLLPEPQKTTKEQEINEIDAWLLRNFRPCSDTFSRVKHLLEEVRAARGLADPHLRIPTLDEFMAQPHVMDRPRLIAALVPAVPNPEKENHV